MKTIETILVFDFVCVPKIHFRIGSLDNIGHPDPDSLTCVLSIPPNTIISWFFTRIIDLNLLVEVGGGEVIVVVVEVKLVILTAIFMVTSSSPATNGVISIERLASTGTNCCVTTVCGLRDPSTFCVLMA